MGLVLFEEKGGELNFWGFIWTLISNTLAIVLLYSGLKEGFSDAALFSFGIFALMAAAFDVGIVRMIKNRMNSAEFHQKQIDYIEGRTKERTPSLVESMNRLSSKEYLDALRSYGVEVPDYFYERLQNRE